MESALKTFEVSGSDPRVKYKSGQMDGKRMHVGQIKLAMALIDFINYALKRQSMKFDGDIFLAYVGIAPGQYMGLILGMFPGLVIESWDPNALRVRDNVIVDPMTEETTRLTASRLKFNKRLFKDRDVSRLAAKVADYKKDGYLTLFVSDIRQEIASADHAGRLRAEKNIIEDMELQAKWAKGVQADFSQFKFRPPYSYIKRKDGSVDEFPTIDYFPGIVRRQVFAPVLSSETRLIVSQSELGRVKTYDNEKYEQQLFWYNTKVREHSFGDSRPFQNLKSTRRFNDFVDKNRFSVDVYWTLRIIADYTHKSRGMPWNAAETKNLERVLLDLILKLCISKTAFKELGHSDEPLGTPSC